MRNTPSIEAAGEVATLLWPSFFVYRGAVFAQSVVSGSLRRARMANPEDNRPWTDTDRTGIEASENHVHILDLFEHGVVWNSGKGTYRTAHRHFKAAERFGRIMAESWFAKLSRDFPGERFRVYYTRNDNPIVRFHRVYEGELPWLDETGREVDVVRGDLLVLATNVDRET